jgi:hypothetical protein
MGKLHSTLRLALLVYVRGFSCNSRGPRVICSWTSETSGSLDRSRGMTNAFLCVLLSCVYRSISFPRRRSLPNMTNIELEQAKGPN